MSVQTGEVSDVEKYGWRPAFLNPGNCIQDMLFEEESKELMSHSQIELSATNGAKLMAHMFGLNESVVREDLQKDFKAIVAGFDGNPNTSVTAIPGLVLGEEGSDWISPSQLIAARNRALKFRGLSQMHVSEDMYLGRPAEWWNKTTPKDTVSHLGGAGIHGLVIYQYLVKEDAWQDRQEQLAKVIEAGSNDIIATEGLSIANWNIYDQLAVETEKNRQRSFIGFVQHAQDRVDYKNNAIGPTSGVGGERAALSTGFESFGSVSRTEIGCIKP